MTGQYAYWGVRPRDQGQIVTDMYPQVGGEAEGEEGQAKGLRLTYDSSDGEWVLRKCGREVRRGNRFNGQLQPTVSEAMEMAQASE